jgi:hypothetical protein
MAYETVRFTSGFFRSDPDRGMKRFDLGYSVSATLSGQIIFRISESYIRVWQQKVPWRIDEVALGRVFLQVAFDAVKRMATRAEAEGKALEARAEITFTVERPLSPRYEQLGPSEHAVPYNRFLPLK